MRYCPKEHTVNNLCRKKNSSRKFCTNAFLLTIIYLCDIINTTEAENISQKELTFMTYEEALSAIPKGRYRHYKGNEYEVLEIAHHSETLEAMVVYRALYGKYEVWVRPAEMWNEKVGDVLRFTKID